MKEIKRGTVYCPCCGYFTLPSGDTGKICEICFWECDFEVEDRVTIPSVVNHGLTLNKAKENFERFGAMQERFLQYVVPYESRLLYKHVNDEVDQRYYK